MVKETFDNLPEAKRVRLVDAMVAAYAAKRYSQVAVSDITDAAGIAKGSFYQYFDDKADAYRYVVRRAMEIRSAALTALDAEAPFAEALRAFRDGSRALAAEHPALYAILARALTDPDAPTGDFAAEIRAALHGDLVGLVRRGVDSGELRADLDVDLAAYLIETAYAQVGPYLITRLDLSDAEVLAGGDIFDRPEIARIIDDLTHLLLRALGAS